MITISEFKSKSKGLKIVTSWPMQPVLPKTLNSTPSEMTLCSLCKTFTTETLHPKPDLESTTRHLIAEVRWFWHSMKHLASFPLSVNYFGCTLELSMLKREFWGKEVCCVIKLYTWVEDFSEVLILDFLEGFWGNSRFLFKEMAGAVCFSSDILAECWFTLIGWFIMCGEGKDVLWIVRDGICTFFCWIESKFAEKFSPNIYINYLRVPFLITNVPIQI